MLLEDFSILDFGVRNDASLELGREEAGTPIQFRNTQRVPDSGMRNHTHCEFRIADSDLNCHKTPKAEPRYIRTFIHSYVVHLVPSARSVSRFCCS